MFPLFPLFHLSAPFVSVSADSTGSVCCFLFNSDLPLSRAAHSAMKSADAVTVKHAAVVLDFFVCYCGPFATLFKAYSSYLFNNVLIRYASCHTVK